MKPLIAIQCCITAKSIPARYALLLGLTLLVVTVGFAEAQQLPVPSQGLPGYVTGAQEVPDPGLTYKVVFAVASAGPADQVHPHLAAAARYLNVLAEYGVPPIRRQVVILLYGAATPLVLQNAAFAARHHGQPNPDAALIEALKAAGASVRVGGEDLLAAHLAPKEILPAVQVDLSAVSTLVNLQLHGYVRAGE